ncbi:MAG: hypothetical protein Q4G08_01230 [Capnocytophaga sp.]|nr:hypothetical protein [Capnocytophaga sp.]
MKNILILSLFQALISVVSGIFISQMSWIGRVGISLKFREYLILKTWWKTALLLLAVQLSVMVVLLVFRKIHSRIGRVLALLLLVAGIAGVYFTYNDFTTTNHRLMRQNFHIGFYLFWVGWLITCIYFLFLRKNKSKARAIVGTTSMQQESSTILTENT